MKNNKIKTMSFGATLMITLFLYSFTLNSSNVNDDCGDVSNIEQSGVYTYGRYSSPKYKITCSCGKSGYIYYNEQKKSWMRTTSSFADYSSRTGTDALKKSAGIFCKHEDR